MRFATFAIAAVTAFASVNAQLTPSAIVKNIEEVTDLSDDTNDLLTDLQGGRIFTVIPRVITNLKDIVSLATKDASMLSNAGNVDLPVDGQKEICVAFTGFVKVHQNLLNTLIGKKGLLASTPFGAPVALVLRAIEGVVDKFAFALIGLVPTCAADAKKDAAALDKTLDDAIKAFSFKLPFGEKA